MRQTTHTISKRQKKFLDETVKGNYFFDKKTGTVSVHGDVIYYQETKASKLPIIFSSITGHVTLYVDSLKSLEGLPEEIGSISIKFFNKSKMEKLGWKPKKVKGYFLFNFDYIREPFYGQIICDMEEIMESGVELTESAMKSYNELKHRYIEQQMIKLI